MPKPMFLFHTNNDVLVDGSLDMSWVASNGKEYLWVRVSLYTDWNPFNISIGCNQWRDNMIRQYSNFRSVHVSGNSDTIYNLIESFKEVSHIGIEIIKGT